jgi:hypothetical protein
MNNLIFRIVLAFFLLTAGCKKKDDTPKNVIFGLTADSSSVRADGTTTIHITCQLNGEATADRRNILFKLNGGTFAANPVVSDTTLLQAAGFINNTLVATVAVTVPQSPGSLIVSAQPALPGLPNTTYVIRDTITLYPSVPAFLRLAASNSGINSNAGSEVTFTGTLYNADTGKVSLNYRVKFEDILDDQGSAGGMFRGTDSLSNASSQVSTIYAAGGYSVGTRIHIRCTLLDSLGNKTPKVDSAYIYINK